MRRNKTCCTRDATTGQATGKQEELSASSGYPRKFGESAAVIVADKLNKRDVHGMFEDDVYVSLVRFDFSSFPAVDKIPFTPL